MKFRFFHRVEDLELGQEAGQPVVERIKLTRQVRLTGGEDAAYHPLVDVGGLPCWPSQPDYAQIVEGQRLRALVDGGGIDLEAPADRTGLWDGQEEVILKRGHQGDFDAVVLAIPVAALPAITSGFGAQGDFGARWIRMLQEVKTVPTQAMQLWLRADLQEMGGAANAPVWGTHVEPMDTYADMSPALRLEAGGPEVKQLAYFCGALRFDGQDQAAALEQVRATGRELIEQHAHRFWPRLGKGREVRWDLLHGTDPGHSPEERFREQYFRANILPSERFSASFPGSTKHRLPPALPAVLNLFLAGDWTDNPLNVGCVEATVMSGLMAARALAPAEPILVAGETDDYLWLGEDRETPEALAAE